MEVRNSSIRKHMTKEWSAFKDRVLARRYSSDSQPVVYHHCYVRRRLLQQDERQCLKGTARVDDGVLQVEHEFEMQAVQSGLQCLQPWRNQAFGRGEEGEKGAEIGGKRQQLN